MIHGDPSIYSSKNYCAIDFETTGHFRDPKADVVCLCWYDSKGKSGKYVGGSLLPNAVVKKLLSYDFILAHSARFEAGWLQRCGIDTRKLTFFCTYTAEWLLRGGLPAEKGALGLDGVAERRGLGAKHEWPKYCLQKGILASDIPINDLTSYCLTDARLSAQLFPIQYQELLTTCDPNLVREKPYHLTLLALQYQRSMLAPVLADIESKGLQLDKQLVAQRHQEAVARREELNQKLYSLTGGVNLASNKQLGEYLYGTLGFECTVETDKGSPSTSIGTIESLAPKTKDQKDFKELYLEFNRIDQSLSKYLSLFKSICEDNDGLMYGELNQGTTVTHRLSSSGVPFIGFGQKKAKSCQFQNIPRGMKELFISRDPSKKIVEVDGSQLEFRVAAGLAHDPVAIKEIVELVDVHSITAATLNCSRQEAKAKTFSPLFGGMGSNKAERKYCEFFRKKYHVIYKMQDGWCKKVLLDPKNRLYTDYGMVYNYPNTRMQADGYISGSTNIFNYPVQGLATAEIIPIALAYLWHHLPDDGSIELVNTIHDSVVAEVSEGRLDRYRSLSITAFTRGVEDFLRRVYGYVFRCPLGVGIKVGERWGSGTERTFQTEGSGIIEIVKRADGSKEKVPYLGSG